MILLKEEEIIRGLQGGDDNYFPQLLDLYKNRIFALAYKFTNNYDESQDLSQDIFLKVYRELSSFNFQSKFSTWIYKVATNTCIDWNKKNKLISLTSIDDINEENGLSSDYSTPEESVLSLEKHKEIHGIIYKMPNIYKTVIIMYHLNNMSYKEISKALDISDKTVETRLYRARRLLKDELKKINIGGEFQWIAGK